MLRRANLMAALIACAIYAALLPWAVAMRAAAHPSVSTSLETALKSAICNGTGPSLPAGNLPSLDCEICKALAAMSIGFAAIPAPFEVRFSISDAEWSVVGVSVSGADPVVPRSRGPPIIA